MPLFRKTFAIGGIHPAPHKEADPTPRLLPLPRKVYLPLSQHIGAPAKPIVAKGDRVSRGQLVADHPVFVSAGVHSPITGTVLSIDNITMANGKPSPAIIIQAGDDDHLADTTSREQYWHSLDSDIADRTLSERTDADTIRRRVADAGIVGMGGAAFPSHVKLSTDGHQPSLLIINGCECEPYLMCDDALMRTFPHRVAEGIEIMMKGAGIAKAIVAIEDNKPLAAKAMEDATADNESISVVRLRTRYPQGGEKQLVQAVTGRRVPSGGLPADVGVVVHNIATAFAVWQAVDGNSPLIERIVTVSGDIDASERRNYIAAIGTPLSELPFTMPRQPLIISGGPMMGRTVVNMDAPVTKGTSGLTVLDSTRRPDPKACIRCGRCIQVCPMGLEPYLLATYGRLHRWPEARDNSVADCIECGSCSYTCPSARPLLDFIRLAKQRSRNLPKQQ